MNLSRSIPLLLPLLFLIQHSLSAQELFEGKIESGTYQNEKIGWKMPIPSGWEVQSRERVAQVEGIGKDAMENASGQEIEKTHTPLLYLEKDRFNRFTSAYDHFDAQKDGDFKESTNALYQFILQTYKQRGMKVSHEIGREVLGGIPFETLSVSVFSPDGEKELFRQKMFDTLLNNKHSFGMSMMYNSEENRKEILSAMQNASFPKIQ